MSTEKTTKKRILWYSDTPISTTGFGNVARNLIQRLGSDYDITVIGINSDGHSYNKEDYPCDIIPAFSFHPLNADGNIYGYKKLLHYLASEDWDYFFTLQDTFIMKQFSEKVKEIQEHKKSQGRKVFKWAGYYPTDMPLHPDWIIRSVMLTDTPVSYNQYGIDSVMAQEKNIPELKNYEKFVKKIYHGSNEKEFHVSDKDEVESFTQNFFNGKVSPDDFLITNINRNQSRKDIARTLMIFKEVKKQIPNAKLYTHCLVSGDKSGINLLEVARRIGLDTTGDWLYPHPSLATPGTGMPVSDLNLIYNRSNLNISTSLGEGWGLSSTESMLTKTINLMPNHTSFPEIIGENEERGYLMSSGNKSTNFMVLGARDNSVVRPLVDVDDAVEKIVHIYNNNDEVQQKIDTAYNWVKENLDWDKIAQQWRDEVFI